MSGFVPSRKSYAPLLKVLEEKINRSGFAILSAGGPGNPRPFSHTIGLYKKYGFEVIVNIHNGDVVLENIVKWLSEHEVILNKPIFGFATLPCIFRECTDENAMGYCHAAFAYYEHPVPIYQLVIPDPDGRLPEDPLFDHKYMDHRQELLY